MCYDYHHVMNKLYNYLYLHTCLFYKTAVEIYSIILFGILRNEEIQSLFVTDPTPLKPMEYAKLKNSSFQVKECCN